MSKVLGEKAPTPCMCVMQAVSVQQSEDLAMSDANGAAMADLLSALDSALLNGEPGAHHPLYTLVLLYQLSSVQAS